MGMQILESLQDAQRLVGELGKPIPKLSLAERRHVRAVLKASDFERLDAAWIIRLFLVAGLPLSDRKFDAMQICRALPPYDIGHFLDRLSNQERVVNAEIPLEAIALTLKREDAARTLNREDAVQTFHSLFRLAHTGVHADLQDSSTTRTRFEPGTALALLKTASRIAALIVLDARDGLSKVQFARRRTAIKSFVDLAYFTATKCETSGVSAATLDLMFTLSRRVGWADFDRAAEMTPAHSSYLYSLPAKLAPMLLSHKRIAEIEILAARAALFDQSRETFQEALRNTLSETTSTIPMASREWVEGFLGLKRPPPPPRASIQEH
jgi:hypothetical protein